MTTTTTISLNNTPKLPSPFHHPLQSFNLYDNYDTYDNYDNTNQPNILRQPWAHSDDFATNERINVNWLRQLGQVCEVERRTLTGSHGLCE